MVVGELSTRTDVAVIGGGPGGYTAAIRAAQLGLDVILVERNLLGGTCTNAGCIPSKALIHAAETRHRLESAKGMGIEAKAKLDFRKTQEWKQGVVDSLVDGIGTLCKLNGVEIMKGRAFFTSSKTLSVETDHGLSGIEFKKAIIATGTKVRGLEHLPYDHKRIIDSDDALSLTSVPKRMLIVGGGYIAAEMACMYLRLGSKVTVIYRGERLLKRMEPGISAELLKGIKELGGEVLFRSKVESAKGSTAVVKNSKGKEKLQFDKLLIAIGRDTDFKDLGLGKTKVKPDAKGRIDVDATMRTADETIYAIGDVVPGPQLAHKAFREGKVAAEAIAGKKSAYDNAVVPMVVFSYPEIASAGLTEEQARQQGHSVKVGKMPFSAIGRARCIGNTKGFVKVVSDEKGVLLGMHIAGPGAGDLIAEAALAIEMGAMLEDVAMTIHAHPTLPEALAEAAEDALGKAIHLYKKRR
jgi:dihydrolipoamide dehydrogenase